MVTFAEKSDHLVSLGFRVFPLIGKHPAIKAWPTLASTDPDVIDAWSRQWPEANVAIACGPGSGIVVVDIDIKNSAGGEDSIRQLERIGCVFPPCPEVVTASGGRHLYYRYRSGLRNIAGVTKGGRGLGRGIDFRTDGGFVVAASSVTDKGSYRWRYRPLTPEFPAFPDWAAIRLRDRPVAIPSDRFEAKGDIAPLVRFAARQQQGGRNNALYWAACRAADAVRSQSVNASSAEAQLVAAGIQCGLPRPEVEATIASAFRSIGDRK
jgi:hypothetical protein